MKRPLAPGHVALAELLYALMYLGPISAKELAEFSGLNRLTVNRMIKAFHTRRVVYIASWEADSDGRYKTKLWRFGKKPDAEKPAPMGRVYTRNRLKNKLLANLGRLTEEQIRGQ